MGRKRHNLAGLSRFVREAFSQPAEPGEPSASSAGGTPAVITAGTTRKLAQRDEADLASESSAVKKRKLGLLGPGYEKYDATGLLPFYTDVSEVPEHLRKYFYQRERYFSLYSSGCLLDEEGWYSVTPELIAIQIAERCRCNTVLDAFCGVGGNAIAFAQTCERVIAIDNSPTRLALARHNAVIYGVEERIEFILGDYTSFAKAYLSLPTNHTRKIDVVFLSPPWGGPSYLTRNGDTPTDDDNANTRTDGSSDDHPQFSLAQIQPIHGAELFKLSRKITRNIAYFLPRNTNLKELSSLLDGPKSTKTSGPTISNGKGMEQLEMMEVEEEWMGPKLKALTCYFGGLAAGQEEMFDT